MPYKSEAQRRLFHWLESQGKLSHAKVREYDKATKGKELPEYVKAKRKAFGGEVEAKAEARCPVCDYPLDEIPVALDAGEACPRCGFGNAKDVPHKAHGGMIHGKHARGGEVSCARCGAVHGYARGGKVPMRCAHCARNSALIGLSCALNCLLRQPFSCAFIRTQEENRAEKIQTRQQRLTHSQRLRQALFAPRAHHALGEIKQDQHRRPLHGVDIAPERTGQWREQRQYFQHHP